MPKHHPTYSMVFFPRHVPFLCKCGAILPPTVVAAYLALTPVRRHCLLVSHPRHKDITTLPHSEKRTRSERCC